MTSKTLRIGTRDSKLALWQAKQVQQKLLKLGHRSSLVPIKSPGDIDLVTPLHQFGTTGVFTKILDVALLENQIDLAVHSLKDYPTNLPEGITIPAVLERGAYADILVPKTNGDFLKQKEGNATIATGSIRRIAQWKNRYPNHNSTNLRGNVQTRLNKLEQSNWQGAIFAKAGLERIGILPPNYINLSWMIPAPAQGIVGITCLSADDKLNELLGQINHPLTYFRAKIERDFLNEVEGGCSAPVGALTTVKDRNILLKAGVFALDGSQKIVLEKTAPLEKAQELGRKTATEVLKNGGQQIMDSIANG